MFCNQHVASMLCQNIVWRGQGGTGLFGGRSHISSFAMIFGGKFSGAPAFEKVKQISSIELLDLCSTIWPEFGHKNSKTRSRNSITQAEIANFVPRNCSGTCVRLGKFGHQKIDRENQGCKGAISEACIKDNWVFLFKPVEIAPLHPQIWQCIRVLLFLNIAVRPTRCQGHSVSGSGWPRSTAERAYFAPPFVLRSECQNWRCFW